MFNTIKQFFYNATTVPFWYGLKEDALRLCRGFEVVEQRAQQLFFRTVTRIAPDMERDQLIQRGGGFNVGEVAACQQVQTLLLRLRQSNFIPTLQHRSDLACQEYHPKSIWN